VSDPYDQAARRIVSILHDSRARRLLELLEHDGLLLGIVDASGPASGPAEEARLAQALDLLQTWSDAIDQIVWDERKRRIDLDDVAHAEIIRRLVRALRRELDSN
jgi:hypothetical protein